MAPSIDDQAAPVIGEAPAAMNKAISYKWLPLVADKANPQPPDPFCHDLVAMGVTLVSFTNDPFML
jgi:hypothetical protein